MIDRRDLDLNRRRDLEIISALVNPGDRVLDLGCGDGAFLLRLLNGVLCFLPDANSSGIILT